MQIVHNPNEFPIHLGEGLAAVIVPAFATCKIAGSLQSDDLIVIRKPKATPQPTTQPQKTRGAK